MSQLGCMLTDLCHYFLVDLHSEQLQWEARQTRWAIIGDSATNGCQVRSVEMSRSYAAYLHVCSGALTVILLVISILLYFCWCPVYNKPQQQFYLHKQYLLVSKSTRPLLVLLWSIDMY